VEFVTRQQSLWEWFCAPFEAILRTDFCDKRKLAASPLRTAEFRDDAVMGNRLTNRLDGVAIGGNVRTDGNKGQRGNIMGIRHKTVLGLIQ
jgi:hypothetical protein